MAQVALSGPQRAMLTALSLAEDVGLTERKMANAAGYKSQASANRAFAAAGLLIANYLSVEAPADAGPGDPEGTTYLGFRGAKKKDEDPGNWVLHPELREAVRASI
jgi:hypothetical protein